MNSIVIPYQRHHRIPMYKDVELKFALRSIERYWPGEVWIIGDKTKFHVNHIPFPDEGVGKEFRISRKILAACENPNISEDFIMWNDDHFQLKQTEIKYWHNGDIKLKRQKGDYGLAIQNTIEAGCEKYFDVHAPIIYNKDLFIDRVINADWKPGKQYVIKSLYCKGMEGEFMEDCKINAWWTVKAIKSLIYDKLFFSTGHYGLTPEMIEVLEELYPAKSKWE